MLKVAGVILWVVWVSQTVLADCAVTAEDWQKILNGFASPNFYGTFKAAGDCAVNGTGLRAKYGDCNTATETVVVTQQAISTNCRTQVANTLYTGNGVLTPATAASESIDICTRTVGNLVNNYLCDPTEVPGCPTPLFIPKFAAMVRCLAGNMTLAERETYFATKQDISCMLATDFCDAFRPFQSCLNTFTDIVDFVYTTNTHECSSFFEGAADMEERCSGSTRDMYLYYCPTPSFLQKNLVAIAVGVPVSAIGLALFVFCIYKVRSGYVSDLDVMAGADGSSPELLKRDSATMNLRGAIHPELAAVMEKKSKYKGISYDINNRMWRSNATGQLYNTEMEAAQAAYFAQANSASPKGASSLYMMKSPSSPNLTQQNSFSSVSNSPIAAYVEPEYVVETDETKLARRMKQLANFYEYWDSDKPDIPGHVDNLFKRHDFPYIARAVKTKYGILPAGWDFELEGQ